MCRTAFETLWGKLQTLLWMELITDVTLLFLESKLYLVLIWGNIACQENISVKKGTFSCFEHQNLGANSGMLIWKFNLDNNRPIVGETTDLSFSKNLMGVKENSCCSALSLWNPETYVEQNWCYKIFVTHPDLIFWGKLQNLVWLEIITDATFLM